MLSFVFFSETGFHYVALFGLNSHGDQTGLVLRDNVHLCLQRAGIKVSAHTQLSIPLFLFFLLISSGVI